MWKCNNCSELVDDHFEMCWNCCIERPDNPEQIEGDPDSLDSQSAPSDAADEPPQISPLRPDSLLTLLRWCNEPLKRWICPRSRLLIALVLQGVLLFAFWIRPEWFSSAALMAAIFLPGAIQRWKFTHLVVMGGLGVASVPLTTWLTAYVNPSDNFMWGELADPATRILLVAVGEWLLRPGDSLRRLGWTVACGVAVAGIWAAFYFFLWHTPSLEDITRYTFSSTLAALTWLAIPAGERIADGTAKTRVVGFASIALMLAGFVYVYQVAIYELGRQSLVREGFFSRNYAVLLLDHRGSDADYEFLLEQLRLADWETFDYPSPTADGWRENALWRETAINRLIRNDADAAAEQLAAMLLEQPSEALINMAGDLFIEKKRYETVPIYMRYALVESEWLLSFAVIGDNRFKKALDELEVPQVAAAWLVDEAYCCATHLTVKAQDEGRPPTFTHEDLFLREHLREKLAEFLGKDAGHWIDDWETLYDERIADAPTPLSEPVREETDHVVECFRKYQAARDRWYEAANQHDAEEPDAPDWTAPGSDGLQREIDDYLRRVEEAIKTLPESDPAPEPAEPSHPPKVVVRIT